MMFEKQILEVAAGINYEYVYIEGTDPLQPTLLFLHGFPSSFYCWRHQIEYFSSNGFACLAPNLMGYGKTYSPDDKNQYKTKSMVEHLIKLLDKLSIDKVIVLGHDWGTRPATRFALYHPERIYGLVLLSVGYNPPQKFDYEQTLQISKQILGYENLGYWQFFVSDDAEEIIQKNIDSFLHLGYTNDPTLWKTNFAPLGQARNWITQGKTTIRASFVTDEDLDVLRQTISEGMKTKLNWYRAAIDNIDYEDELDLNPTIQCSVLFIAGTNDYICVPKLFSAQSNHIQHLETHELNTSHWIMEEKPMEVNQTIEQWIDRL